MWSEVERVSWFSIFPRISPAGEVVWGWCLRRRLKSEWRDVSDIFDYWPTIARTNGEAD